MSHSSSNSHEGLIGVWMYPTVLSGGCIAQCEHAQVTQDYSQILEHEAQHFRRLHQGKPREGHVTEYGYALPTEDGFYDYR